MIDIEKKLAALEALYRIYETFDSGTEAVCRKGCACCCTARVTMTTLEGYHIAAHLGLHGKETLFDEVKRNTAPNRFIPKTTTNGLAATCLHGKAPPAEASAKDAGNCPALEENRCRLYPVRPLSCRTMVSRTDCAATGFADMDDFSVTVATVLMQYVEHLDADGCSGNFSDVMLAFASTANRQFYREGLFPCAEHGLVENRRIPALMIPPEYRRRIAPLLEKIRGIRV